MTAPRFKRGDRVVILTRPGSGSPIHGRHATVTNADPWNGLAGLAGLVEVDIDDVGAETLHRDALRLLSLPERIGEIERAGEPADPR